MYLQRIIFPGCCTWSNCQIVCAYCILFGASSEQICALCIIVQIYINRYIYTHRYFWYLWHLRDPGTSVIPTPVEYTLRTAAICSGWFRRLESMLEAREADFQPDDIQITESQRCKESSARKVSSLKRFISELFRPRSVKGVSSGQRSSAWSACALARKWGCTLDRTPGEITSLHRISQEY